MNKFDLNAYGVSEMNKKEMVETDGGVVVAVVSTVAILGTYAALDLIFKWENAYSPADLVTSIGRWFRGDRD